MVLDKVQGSGALPQIGYYQGSGVGGGLVIGFLSKSYSEGGRNELRLKLQC